MKSGRKVPGVEGLPLFATDDEIAAHLLGEGRALELRQMVPLLEARGLPKIDPLMGGRYVPALRAFFDHRIDCVNASLRRLRNSPDNRRRDEPVMFIDLNKADKAQ
jgi:hypothetical protein